MDIEVIKAVIGGQARVASINDVADIISGAINIAAPMVWKAHPWSFRRKETTLITTSGTEYVDFPEDFDGFKGMEYRGTGTGGWQIIDIGEDAFTLGFPNPASVNDNEPRVVKVVKDGDTGKWRAYYHPRPNAAYSHKLIYFIKWGSVEEMPEYMADALIAKAWTFIHSPGSEAHSGAKISYRVAVAEAKANLDNVKAPVKVDVIVRSSQFAEDYGGGVSNVSDWLNYEC